MHAREMQGHTHAAMAIDAATKAKDAGLGRLAYDALKWHASKIAPKVYGDNKTERGPQEDSVDADCGELPHYVSLPGVNRGIDSPSGGRYRIFQSNLISHRNFSLQVLEHRQMHLDHHAGEDSDVLVIVSGQNRIQEACWMFSSCWWPTI